MVNHVQIGTGLDRQTAVKCGVFDVSFCHNLQCKLSPARNTNHFCKSHSQQDTSISTDFFCFLAIIRCQFESCFPRRWKWHVVTNKFWIWTILVPKCWACPVCQILVKVTNELKLQVPCFDKMCWSCPLPPAVQIDTETKERQDLSSHLCTEQLDKSYIWIMS